MTTHVSSAPSVAPAGSRPHRFTSNQVVVAAVLLAAVLAGFSLIVTASIDYDPMGWIVYAREVFGHGVLDTNTYPSWKPLPVLLIGPFTLLTHGFADVYWWLFVCRFLGILAVFGVAAVAYRFAGVWAALAAGTTILFAPWWFEDMMIGRDGPPCAGLLVIALLLYYKGWTRLPGICLVAISLLRPEMTPFTLLYGLWAWRMKRLTLFEVALAMVVIGVMWEIPTLIHAGKSPGSLATSGGVAGTPINAKIPFLAVFTDAAKQMRYVPSLFVVVATLSTLWGLLPAGRGTRFASIWGRDNHERVLIAFAALWVLMIACETQFLHFSGNVRYQTPGLTVWCIIAGVAVVRTGGLFMIRGSYKWGAIIAAVISIISTAALSPRWERKSVDLIKQRQSQLNQINADLARAHCPGYAWADPANNAYLAVITNQSLPATIVPSSVPPKWINGHYQYVYCAPASFKPAGKA